MLAFVLKIFATLLVILQHLFSPAQLHFGRRKSPETQIIRVNRRKPEWVQKEVIKLKALMPKAGCRIIADTFNRLFEATRNMTVGKTFASDVIRDHEYEIKILAKKIKNAKPKPVPQNLVWAMDLTGKTDSNKKTHQIIGIVEHNSRANLCLKAIDNKSSLNLTQHLVQAIRQYGKPKALRTDNESAFTSWFFRLSLFLLGIKHQKTDKGCPWQNGRIERFFGTLKEKLNQWEVDSLENLNASLVQFAFWYNHVRPHQNLSGRTPAEVWNNADIFKKPAKEYWFEAWDGLLQGYYLRH